MAREDQKKPKPTPQSSPKKEGPSRRDVLRIAAGGGALAGIAATYFVLSGGDDNKEKKAAPEDVAPGIGGLIAPDGDLSAPHLAEVYGALTREIKSIVNTARKQNKKPLLVMGDCHNSDEAFMIELMVLDIMKKLNPAERNLFIEATEKNTNRILEHGLGASEAGNIPCLTAVAKSTLSYKVKGVDDQQANDALSAFRATNPTERAFEKMLDKYHDQRDQIMASRILANNSQGVVICGAAHMKGIIQNIQKQSSNYLVAAMNISPIGRAEADALDGNNIPKIKAAMQYAADPAHAGQIKVTDSRKAERLPLNTMLDMVIGGIQHYNTTQRGR
ncbi:MAG: hypothetical protein K2Q01_00180 [Rickettsiales bacterium]|nr:hypothetical protein [Rickettsiales bacterium]